MYTLNRNTNPVANLSQDDQKELLPATLEMLERLFRDPKMREIYQKTHTKGEHT